MSQPGGPPAAPAGPLRACRWRGGSRVVRQRRAAAGTHPSWRTRWRGSSGPACGPAAPPACARTPQSGCRSRRSGESRTGGRAGPPAPPPPRPRRRRNRRLPAAAAPACRWPGTPAPGHRCRVRAAAASAPPPLPSLRGGGGGSWRRVEWRGRRAPSATPQHRTASVVRQQRRASRLGKGWVRGRKCNCSRRAALQGWFSAMQQRAVRARLSAASSFAVVTGRQPVQPMPSSLVGWWPIELCSFVLNLLVHPCAPDHILDCNSRPSGSTACVCTVAVCAARRGQPRSPGKQACQPGAATGSQLCRKLQGNAQGLQ